MFSITLKRSAATLGVVAGLLAAAAPANAQFWQGMSLRSQAPINVEPQMSLTGWPDSPINDSHSASAQIGPGMVGAKSPTDPASGFTPPIGTDKGSLIILAGTADDQMSLTEHEGAAFRGEVTGLEPNALGTQVGSEGVKAPKPPASSERPTESISFNYLKAAGTETGNPERSGSALASSRAGAFAIELEGKIVKAPASPTSLVFTSVSNVAVATAVVGGLVPGGAIVSA